MIERATLIQNPTIPAPPERAPPLRPINAISSSGPSSIRGDATVSLLDASTMMVVW